MLPSILFNSCQFHDYVTHILKHCGGTAEIKGPINILATSDPQNVDYILNKNFGNYSRGSSFIDISEAFGAGVFSSDADVWKHSRDILKPFFRWKSFELLVERTIQNKLEICLFPLLDQVKEQFMEVNLQDIFRRFTFDSICSLVMGFDPNSLTIDFPKFHLSKAFDQVSYTVFY
ncbi:hypothetical protein L6164_013398 [Bauhinia variegata]|uniref:Uncharacterized protein n=1 Tax=Bauhinia variegata TaxID=167791 RepID=A0ACB9NFI0_BAUVA|nr:hypothetical protein L6164_013398 [Bauhinia variegata]